VRSQAQGILALDFFTADLVNGTRVHVLAVTGHGSRRVRVLGATEHPVQSWVVRQARNLLMDLEDAGTRVKFVLHDRDAGFTQAFDAVFRVAGIRVIRPAVQAPRMNSITQRWTGGCRRELLDRTLIWNQRHLMMASPTWIISGSGSMTAWAVSSTNTGWWHRLPAPTGQGLQLGVRRRWRIAGLVLGELPGDHLLGDRELVELDLDVLQLFAQPSACTSSRSWRSTIRSNTDFRPPRPVPKLDRRS
jgi:hypothetical protein